MPLTEKDRLLINNLLSGKPGAWNSFVDRYVGLIVQVLRHTAHAHSLSLTTDDIDDLTADVFQTLLERNMGAIRAFRGQSSFATYMTVIVRRVLLRKLAQRRYLAAFGHVKVHQASVTEAVEDSGPAHVDDQDEVDSLMNRLPESMRTVVRMFSEGRTYEQIGSALGKPVNSIGPLLARARGILRQAPPSAG